MRTLRWSSSVWPPHSRPAGSAVNVGGGEERREEDSKNQGNMTGINFIVVDSFIEDCLNGNCVTEGVLFMISSMK